MKKGKFEVAEGMTVIPPNDVHDLTSFADRKDDYVVVGGGKTSMDCITHLLEEGVDAKDIRWIIPKNPMIIDRDDVFLGKENLHFMSHYPLVEGEEAPAYKCCVLSREEHSTLIPVFPNIVKFGRISSISESEIQMKNGSIPVSPESVIVDCSVNGLTVKPTIPIWQEDKMVLQCSLHCQQVFSAAFQAKLESMDRLSDTEKNDITSP